MWDLATLAPGRALPRPGGPVNCLAEVDGELWGGVRRDAVVWGRL